MNARQLFDVWQIVVQAVQAAMRYPGMAMVSRSAVYAWVKDGHGEPVALEALAYFDKLRADTTQGAGGRKP